MLACPNPTCPNHLAPAPGFTRRYGTRKVQGAVVPRVQCRACLITWSPVPRERPNRRDLDRRIFEMAVSGTPMRRIALLLGCDRKTVPRTIARLVERIKEQHAAFLSGLQTSYVMMDELETYMAAHWQQFSLTMVVRAKPQTNPRTGKRVYQVLAFGAARHTTTMIGYPWVHHERATVIPQVLQAVAPSLKARATIATDGATEYPKWIAQHLPGVKHEVHVAKNPATSHKASKSVYDPLFAINHTFARLRADLPRLHRTTWTTTKSLAEFERHVWLWVAWNNGYEVG